MFDVSVLGIFARAGGGGSSSSGSAEGVFFVIPAVAAGGVANFVRKKTGSKAAAFFVGVAAGLAVSLLYLFGGIFWFSAAVVSTVIGASGAAFVDKLGKFRKNSATAQMAVQQAAASDSMWNQQSIIDYATQVFNRFQYDWSNFDTESIRQYTTQRYANHVGLMLYALHQMGRKNIMENIQINEVILTGAHDDVDNQGDRVSVSFLAQAQDKLIEVASGRQLTASDDEFGEQWNFVREGNMWKLDSIDPGTADPSMLVKSLKEFAAANQMYFSADWGRLLLPTRGQLFTKGFVNDVNNHVIGFWTGNLLVQLYTCGIKNDDRVTQYMVGQITLPKTYGGILVERDDNIIFKKRFLTRRGYKNVKMEWGDFNKHYSVYATDENQVTSFELLNPSFMAWLYDQDMKVDIEVVDNVVYLYSKLGKDEQRYVEMLEILKRSHKELKL